LRLTRRSFIAGAGAAGSSSIVGSAQARPQAPSEPTPIEITATPIDSFSVGERERRDFGALTFRSGLELRSSSESFGGFSGLWRSGEEIVALGDNTQWLTARVVSANRRLTGFANTIIAPVLGRDGRPLRRTRSYDTEGLTIAGGIAYVGIERTQEVMRFNWAKEGVRARAQAVPVPPEAMRLPRNQGLEAIGVAPPRSPLAGAVVVIAEQAGGTTTTPTRGFILSGARKGAFDVVRSGGFDVTDLAFLPSGEMLLLERRASLLRGFGARIRRIAPDALFPEATVDGPVIFEADMAHQVDNMEGLAVHRDGAGETIVSMISDDNFSGLQRTVFLEFALTA
jgi:hypothetical protein